MSAGRRKSPAVPSVSDRCPATRKDGKPCTAKATKTGFCFAHGPDADKARRRGGQSTSRAARADRSLPSRLTPIVDQLTEAMKQVFDGTMPPARLTALSSGASTLIKAFKESEFEERLRALEEAQEEGR